MAYIRKTKDMFILLSNYGYGWEEEFWEDSYKDIKIRLKEYRDNCPNACFKYKIKRIKIA